MEEGSTIRLDIAKRIFHTCEADAFSHEVFRKRLARAKLLELFAAQPPYAMMMKTCAEAHYWAELVKILWEWAAASRRLGSVPPYPGNARRCTLNILSRPPPVLMMPRQSPWTPRCSWR